MRGATLSVGLLAGLCLLSVLAPTGAFGDVTARSADITVDYEYPHLTVRFSHPAALLVVIEKLCDQTNTDCELEPGLDRVLLEPMTVEGTWFEVVRKLFESVPFDLAATAPSPQQAGRLLVKKRSSTAIEEHRAGPHTADGRITLNGETANEAASDGTLRSSATSAAPGSGSQGPQTPQSSTSGSSVALPEVQTGKDTAHGTDLGSATANSVTGQAMQSPAGRALTEDQLRMSVQASHDLYVGPPAGSLPLPPQGMNMFPFPDEDGNPILVPITNQPITVLPFPDSEGRPITVPPGVVGLKLQDPFSYTPIKSK